MLSTDIVADLTANSTINGLVNGNINPEVDKSEQLPSIVYSIGDGMRETKFVNSYGHKTTSVTLNFYTTSYTQVDTFVATIETLYNGTSRQFGSTGNYYAYSRVDDIIRTFDSSDDNVFRCIIELTFIN